MNGYRKSSHTIFDNKFHLVWCTKYRFKVLKGDIAVRCRDIIREICRCNDVEIISGHVSLEHVHLYVSIPPRISVSKIVKLAKGKTSRKLQMEYNNLKKRYWGQHLWARGFFSATVGEINDKLIKEYIESQDKHHHNDNFSID